MKLTRTQAVLLALIALCYAATIAVLLSVQYEHTCWDDPADVTFPLAEHCLGPDPLLQ